ncbi:uncharacterized protein BYT42DRAFT_225205 [Radiomyces spectabilis]|uniref:uncharacterized protein n=1 Tax=Radiomyces spectabilis TaxID=64574 RepID=UPI00221E4266|nr:uncharacterized protein BYT42DRAFT_225205 [Radiomyces spectabilis]KAI8388183.1 hypothetical protein BYT42DRAFT_225205 [Radiomyces spectabilis]
MVRRKKKAKNFPRVVSFSLTARRDKGQSDYLAMNVIYNARIQQAFVRSILFRSCGKCKGRLVYVSKNRNDQTASFYCEACQQFVQSIKASYKLQFIAFNPQQQRFENYVAYEDALQPILGRTAQELEEFLKQNTNVLDFIERQLLQLNCHLILRVARSNRDTAKGVEAIVPVVDQNEWVPIVQKFIEYKQQTTLKLDKVLQKELSSLSLHLLERLNVESSMEP